MFVKLGADLEPILKLLLILNSTNTIKVHTYSLGKMVRSVKSFGLLLAVPSVIKISSGLFLSSSP